jgi:HK97 family phage major capsid protein
VAAKLNEIKQKLIDSKKSLAALLTIQAREKGAVAALLEEQIAAGTVGTDEGKKAVGALRAQAAQNDAKVSAAQEYVLALEEQLHAEEQRISEEERASLARVAAGGGRVVTTHDNRTDRPWASLGEQLTAVCAAGSPGGSIDPRLFNAAATGIGTGTPSDAGFLVQSDFSTRLLERALEESQLVPMCDGFTASPQSDSLEAPYIKETSRVTGSRWGGVRVYRRGEGDTVAASKPELGLFELRLEDMMGLCYLTGRTMTDAALMGQIVERSFASEFAFKADDEVIRGNGVGQMSGLISSTTNPALVTVAIEAGQTLANSNGGLLTQNISKMWQAMPARLKGGAVWLYNGELTPALDHLAIVVASTGVLEPRFVTYGPDGLLRIKGRPAVEIEQCSAPGTVGDFILTNLMEYAILTKGGLQTDASIHVRFIYDELTLRFITRINGKPKWVSAVAPYKGSVSKSPYVVLDTRA